MADITFIAGCFAYAKQPGFPVCVYCLPALLAALLLMAGPDATMMRMMLIGLNPIVRPPTTLPTPVQLALRGLQPVGCT